MRTGKYNFDRVWYEFDMMDHYNDSSRMQDILLWCDQNFGPAPKWGAYPGAPDAWSRWYCFGFVFNFRDEKDYLIFLLRWK